MKVKVVESVLKANDAIAETNRAALNKHGVVAINMMSAPGSGKTTLLQKTIPALADTCKCAVLVGDLQTTRDAERLSDLGAEVVQINTGRGCHLDPQQVTEGLQALDLEAIDLLFIENVGNMVCPASFDLGEHLDVILLSVPEGEDKVAKYPTLFQKADHVLLTKIDLVEALEYDSSVFYNDMKQVNSRATIQEVSSKTDTGFAEWIAWLQSKITK